MASPGTGAKSFFMGAIEQQITNSHVGAPKSLAIGSNFGLVQFPVDPGVIFARSDDQIVPNELTGYFGNPAAIPGRITRNLDLSMPLRTGALIPILGTFLGKPAKTQDGSDPAYNYAYSLSDATTDAASMWGLFHKGGSTYPLAFARARFGELSFESNGTSEVSLKAKGQACLDTEHGLGVADAGNSGTYTTYAPVLMGDRSDANRLVDALKVKISSAPTSGTFKVKVAFGSGSYSTAETTITYNTVSKLQDNFVELVGDSGALGFDECENRNPLYIFFPGDVTTMALNDIWAFPALCQIPGTAAQGGDTTVARTALTGCRFGPAHVSIKRGSSSANVALDFESGSVKLMRQIVPAYTHGAGARNPYDMDIVGYVGIEIEADRRFDSREFERLIRTNDRYVVEVLYQGPVISGSTSLWRDQFKIEIPQARINSVASPLTGPGITKEKVGIVAEQKSDGSAVVTASIRSATSWSF